MRAIILATGGGVTFQVSEYNPRFTGGHTQTLFAWARRRTFPRLPEPTARYFDVAADARVLARLVRMAQEQGAVTLADLEQLRIGDCGLRIDKESVQHATTSPIESPIRNPQSAIDSRAITNPQSAINP